MKIDRLEFEAFLKLKGTILDVRSPGEYAQGHIPGSVNLPMFTDSERALVGTAYKKEGKEKAISLGLRIVGPKLEEYVGLAKTYLDGGFAKVHCWRGGMRSSAIAMLLHTTGIPAVLLTGGYKAFRQWSLKLYAANFNFCVIGGLTGSGKTDILQNLNKCGEQVLDLEGLANHRGSSFGALQMPQQPSTEQFQNEIAMKLSQFHMEKRVWVEDESRMIGTCHIPEVLFDSIKKSPLIFIERPLEERVKELISIYGKANAADLVEAARKISKKLGGLKTEEAITLINEGRLEEAVKILLSYYDSAYKYTFAKRQQPIKFYNGTGLSAEEWANLIRSY